jgi:hypothetical protein
VEYQNEQISSSPSQANGNFFSVLMQSEFALALPPIRSLSLSQASTKLHFSRCHIKSLQVLEFTRAFFLLNIGADT